MDNTFHYPPELFNMLVDTIPLLCRSKNDVLLFFKGAGVRENQMRDIAEKIKIDRKSVNKYDIARTILERINEQGEQGLKVRREILKRVTEFENYSSCWENDRMKAKGYVSEICKVINVKDSFTKMKKERDKEHQEKISIKREKINKEIRNHNKQLEDLKFDLNALFLLNDQPQKRGKMLELVINNLFRISGILIKEDFKRVEKGAGIVEQIDGVVEFEGHIYLVEMKWLKDPIGVDKISQHLVRVYGRDGVRGLFIAANGYAESAILECKGVLTKKVISLINLHEIVYMLEGKRDFKSLLKKKITASIVEKKPYIEVLS